MKRTVLIIVGVLLATAIISATSIGLYAHFAAPRSYWNEAADRVLREQTPKVSDVPDIGEPAHLSSVLPVSRVLDIAARRLPGEVLKIELEHDDGRVVYELKVLAENGRVREISLDAHSGDVIEIEDD